ncbi:MAG: hypothetical protein HY849_04570 [Nitrosomonadales bacterium]|nr:hypothetical protein [Nitrosomonadales bacterium]
MRHPLDPGSTAPWNAAAPTVRLLPFILLAALLHLAALLWFKLPPAPLPTLQAPLEIRFESPATPRPQAAVTTPSHTAHPVSSVPSANKPAVIAKRDEQAAPAAPAFDVSRLREQARNYALQEQRTSTPQTGLEGWYFGSYTGLDSGTFSFTLDDTGHATGSGQSSRYGINFIISGNVATSGLIQMSGSGTAGEAHFNGKLDLKSGELSGTWILAGAGGGTFNGQRE